MLARKLVYILLHIFVHRFDHSGAYFFNSLKIQKIPITCNGTRSFLHFCQTAGFYFNAFVLYPRLLLKKRVATYIFSGNAISILFAMCLVYHGVFREQPP